MNTRALATTLVASLVWLQPSIGAAQDPFTQARALYASADYEEALKLLEAVPAARETHYYRALCLIALGRQDAAENQISAVVMLDPMFVPPAGEVSPRVVSAFAETRRRLLPNIARTTFTDARNRFQAGDRDAARKQFELTLRMLDDAALDEEADLSDLRLVASGFLDLAKLESPAAAAPTPQPMAAPQQPPATQVAAAPAIAAEAAASRGPATATGPVTISQELPPWRPDNSSARGIFSGAVRVEIDETGRVTAARMERPVHPLYDSRVLDAAREWRYKPATLNGVPVASEKTVEIELRP